MKFSVFLIIIWFVFAGFLTVMDVSAAPTASTFGTGLDATRQGAGYTEMTKGPTYTIALMVGKALSPAFLGFVSLLIIIYGGYKWMMARGKAEETEKARSIIVNTIIALALTFSIWGIIQLIIPLWELIYAGRALG